MQIILETTCNALSLPFNYNFGNVRYETKSYETSAIDVQSLSYATSSYCMSKKLF